MAQDHNDIYSIVERLAILEGRITPANVKHGLNTQQKSVPQMPALFKPKTQKILGGNPNAKNPMSGYAVGGCEESEEFDDNYAVNSKIDPFRDRTTIASEGVANEDVLDKVKKTLSDYLDTLKDELKTDSDLKDKKKEDSDLRAKDKNLARKKVAKLHKLVHNQRKDFTHKASNEITNHYKLIGVESLDVKNMQQNKCLAKSISDQGCGICFCNN